MVEALKEFKTVTTTTVTRRSLTADGLVTGVMAGSSCLQIRILELLLAFSAFWKTSTHLPTTIFLR